MLLLGQTFTCLAEQASLLPCAHECTHSEDAPPATGETPHCEATACHSAFVVTAEDVLGNVVMACHGWASAERSRPESPVREIDHPPQLS